MSITGCLHPFILFSLVITVFVACDTFPDYYIARKN